MVNEVIILGKPNVGKSSLFNAIVGKKLALVQNHPGLTRDLRKKKINFLGVNYTLVDSAGISEDINKLNSEIIPITLESIKKSKLILFIVEGTNQFTSEDFKIVEIIRKFNIKKILVVNKSESKLNEYIDLDCEKLGFGTPEFISAEHKIGILDLKLRINKVLKENFQQEEGDLSFDHSVAIVGKPNTGKSTLINNLKGKNISVTGKSPNLTRDPVETEILWKSLNFKIFDTAGISENSKNLKKIEKMSVFETKRKIRLSEIIILILDINNYFEKFNYKLIKFIVEESRFLIVVINKIDTINEFSEKFIKKKIYELSPQIKNTPIFFISAEKKIGLNKLMNGIIKFLPLWNKRIDTNKLNLWLKKLTLKTPPSLHNGKEVKLKFITQINIRPPKFIIFTNFPKAVKESYKRFLVNDLKKTFNFDGIVITLNLSKSNNPYEFKKNN